MLKMPEEMIEIAEADGAMAGWFERNRLAHLPEDNQELYLKDKTDGLNSKSKKRL